MPRQNPLPPNPLGLPTDESGLVLPVSVASLITSRQAKESRAKRKRKWEKDNPAIRYRIPLELHVRARQISTALESIANDYMTTVSSVAAAFMESSLSHVHSGELILEGQPKPERRKMALRWDETKSGWPREIKSVRKKSKVLEKQKPVFLAYRWGADINNQVRGIITETGIASGDVVVRLLEYALSLYRAGRLTPRIESIAVSNKMTVWGSEK
jgi:hypothetical protein